MHDCRYRESQSLRGWDLQLENCLFIKILYWIYLHQKSVSQRMIRNIRTELTL